jgi:hypothetical protein
MVVPREARFGGVKSQGVAALHPAGLRKITFLLALIAFAGEAPI